MSELISRQKLIEELTDVIIKHTCKPSGCQDCLCAFEYGIVEESCEEYLEYHKLAEKIYNEFVINITNQQPPADQWIPCSERLPDKGGTYIVTQERYRLDDRLYKKPVVVETTFADFNFMDDVWNRARHLKVTAWMPLPEPYKGAE